jgi:peptidoglycan hydrolase-like protein with peptidoglycan-binding domain
VFRAPKFNWRRYLQLHLVHSGVNVTDLHPILGLRLAALFVDLTNAGLASLQPGYGNFQILSGVRTRSEQIYLYNRICLQQGRCAYVANPYIARSSGPDAEGVLRYGSNHMAQRQDARWSEAWGRDHSRNPVEVGYAVDFRNTGASWSSLHSRLARFGLDWPLKYGAVEVWHVEAFPDRSPSDLGWLPGPWPRRPGVHRPLYAGLRGGDVRRLQRQLGVDRDAVFGPGTAEAVRRWQRQLNAEIIKRQRRKLDVNGIWDARTQRVFERAQKARVADDIRRRVVKRL